MSILKVIIKILIKVYDVNKKIIDQLVIIENNKIHPKHKLIKYHDFFLNNIKKGSTVLDIGCGFGFVAFDLSKKASSVTGIDFSKKSLKTAKEKFSVKNLTFIYGDATTYKFEKKFDYIVLSNVLEHIEKRVIFLKKIKHLAPIILIRVPILKRDWLTLYKKENGMPYFLDDTHFTEYTIESFEKEMNEAGLKIEYFSINFNEIWAVVKR